MSDADPTPTPAAIDTRPGWIADAGVRHHRLASGDLWIGGVPSAPEGSPAPASPGETTRNPPCDGPLTVHALCAFAARRNPRRGFLFVSKVLGRYLPVRPAALDAVLCPLSARLPADLPGPVLFVGVAAAGVAIGHRVWARYVERTGRDDTAFLTSTRHRFDAPLAYRFDEPHSHAPRHRMHLPLHPTAARRFEQARSMVVVDDEITSGRTFSQLVAAHHARCPALRRAVHAVLTDWTTAPLGAGLPPAVETEIVAVARGRFHFEADPAFDPQMPDVTGDRRPCWRRPRAGHGRFGRNSPLTADTLPTPLEGAPVTGQRILVLGSGEAQYPALLLAERLAACGADAFYQCTVRAPVMPGGPIERVICFDDPLGEGMPNYLYNVDPARFDRVVLCREPDAALPGALVDALGAEAQLVEYDVERRGP